MKRCQYRAGVVGVQCCREAEHEGRHLFRCASALCPGLPFIASITPHPTSCVHEGLAQPSDLEAAEALNRQEWLA